MEENRVDVQIRQTEAEPQQADNNVPKWTNGK